MRLLVEPLRSIVSPSFVKLYLSPKCETLWSLVLGMRHHPLSSAVLMLYPSPNVFPLLRLLSTLPILFSRNPDPLSNHLMASSSSFTALFACMSYQKSDTPLNQILSLFYLPVPETNFPTFLCHRVKTWVYLLDLWGHSKQLLFNFPENTSLRLLSSISIALYPFLLLSFRIPSTFFEKFGVFLTGDQSDFNIYIVD